LNGIRRAPAILPVLSLRPTGIALRTEKAKCTLSSQNPLLHGWDSMRAAQQARNARAVVDQQWVKMVFLRKVSVDVYDE
jgi:hypothetical protein